MNFINCQSCGHPLSDLQLCHECGSDELEIAIPEGATEKVYLATLLAYTSQVSGLEPEAIADFEIEDGGVRVWTFDGEKVVEKFYLDVREAA